MSLRARAASLWHNLIHRQRVERDLDDELRATFDLLVEEKIREGMSDGHARRVAALALGGVEVTKERVRAVRMGALIETIMQDVRYAVRLLAKQRTFTIVAILTLGVGLGVSNTLFTMVYAHVLRGLPVVRPDRVLFVNGRDASGRDTALSFRTFTEIEHVTRAFSNVGAYASTALAVSDESQPAERVQAAYVSANVFRILGEQPFAGRSFEPGDESLPAAMISANLWKSRYNSDPGVIGRTVRLNGTPTRITGVMAPGFRFPNTVDVWQPLALLPGVTAERRDAPLLAVVGRLTDEAHGDDAIEELAGIGQALSRMFPSTHQGLSLTAVPINVRYNGRITDPAWMAFTAAGLIVLLVACANIANLLLMRSVGRSREMALRSALGASRGRLVLQLFVENAVLASMAGILGLLLSRVGIRLASSVVPENALPYWIQYTLDMRAGTMFALISLGTVFVFGVAPAFYTSRTNTQRALKDGGYTSTHGTRVHWWMNGFLAAEFGLTMVLLAAVVMTVRVSREVSRNELVIDPVGVMTASVSLPVARYRTVEQRWAFFEEFQRRVQSTTLAPVTVTSAMPPGASVRFKIAIEGRPATPGTDTVAASLVDSRYFTTLGLLVRGRTFVDGGGTNRQDSVIVNQRFASMYFGDLNPLGQHLRLTPEGETEPPSSPLTIVGVSPTIGPPDNDPQMYLPLGFAPPATAVLLVRGSDKGTADASTLREVVRAIDRDLPLARVMSMEQAIANARWNPRLASMIVDTIACIALALAAVGLYTVVTHGVAQRTHEIGIRLALGARAGQVTRLVLRRAGTQLAIGLITGTACTVTWDRLLGGGDGAIQMTDPETLLAVAAIVTAVAAIACLAPIGRATRVDPLVALRHE